MWGGTAFERAWARQSAVGDRRALATVLGCVGRATRERGGAMLAQLVRGRTRPGMHVEGRGAGPLERFTHWRRCASRRRPLCSTESHFPVSSQKIVAEIGSRHSAQRSAPFGRAAHGTPVTLQSRFCALLAVTAVTSPVQALARCRRRLLGKREFGIRALYGKRRGWLRPQKFRATNATNLASTPHHTPDALPGPAQRTRRRVNTARRAC